eukprot:CAMPEP_0194309842 /NCGR_PEP_ID=MMETSP0171-20130528/6819_1 /TAXON_ID=218684 /ORGANISM="Corethron pennatum, Strain L29A3" /LENGTH=36 /DNA_ID= /DNA_START= /DNA_END= /DNA_ORIENTATION=
MSRRPKLLPRSTSSTFHRERLRPLEVTGDEERAHEW